MKKLSDATLLPQSGIRRMFDLAKNKENTISFVLGEPDFDTPKNVIITPIMRAVARHPTPFMAISMIFWCVPG